ncbi:hypothetical protein NQ317_000809 [Molorchus minor]|uniref:Beta-hexosaminidase n=1 Tax=Molorchus minor TaxID=1323400 RepID=A0ABQ9J3R8_9CUCU|nr:hypothetical protein NQ317_000809 [Molorchus minor]
MYCVRLHRDGWLTFSVIQGILFQRRDRMKQGELRRALMVVTLLCIFLFIYLYWQQTSKLAPTLIFNYKHVYSSNKKSHTPQWTWECINQRCERRHMKGGGVAPISLATCSMLCGSTQLWPQPTGPVTLGSKAVTFNHHLIEFESTAELPARALLEKAYANFNDSIVSLVEKSEYLKETTEIRRFLIRVTIINSDVVRPKLDADEGYSIVLKTRGNEVVANISASNFFGVRHGLETLSQLIWWDEYANGGMLRVLKGATVQDSPAFFLSGRVLVGMSASKLNVFHWHLTDTQSFPLVVPSVPQLAKTGAYSPDKTYAPDEVRALVEFARVRGIRIVLEVDTPAHAGNGWTWGPQAGLGELAVCVNERPWSLYCGEPPCGQLNPENPNVFVVLEKLYRDLLDLSSENEIFHIGGDEVNLECWAQHLQKASTAYNFTDLHDLWGEFTVKALNKLHSANGDKKIPHANIVVQSWGASQWPDTPDLIADGYRVIISHVDAWYLDCGFGRWRETGEAACDPYRPWQTIYNHRPWQQLQLNKKQILGGEACLWSEQLDEGSLDARLWPRSAAFAERMWTDPPLDMTTFNIQEDVYTRLSTHRDRLVRRGINAEALWPAWCTQNPGMCL